MMELSVIAPVYNESDIIDESLNRIITDVKGFCKNFEVIVVDDGSTDDTVVKLSHLEKELKEIRVLRHDVNRGLGAAIKTAVKKCRGEIVVTLDVDLSYSPSQIPNLLSLIGSCDMVIGSPYCNEKDMRAPIIRKLASRVQNKMYSTLLRTNLSCMSGMFRAYKKEVLRCIEIEYERYDSQLEIVIKAIKKGYKVCEVPAVNNWPKNRKSKVVLIREIPNSLRLLIKLMRGT